MTSGMDATPPSAAAAPPAPPKGPVQRIFGALFSPNETFADIARKPDILVPLAVIVFFSLLSTIVVVPKLDFESMMREQFESNKDISAEDADRMVRITAASGKVFAYASPILAIGIFAIVAGVLLLAFRMMAGEGTFKQAFSVTLYSQFPQVIHGLITTVIIMTKSSVQPDQMNTLLKSNLGFLVDPKQQMVPFALLSSLDLFTIWTLVLLIIGFACVSRFSKAKSAAIVISLWIVTVVVKLGFAALGASRMKQT